MTDELDFARHLADVADGISMDAFGKARSRTKADGTIVTEADEAVERALRSEVGAAYPDDAVLGEESGATGGAHRRWILDPIDGTINYDSGIPIWATLIAFEADGEVVAGMVSAPALGERYEAARGNGARRNGEPIRVSETEDLADARIVYTSWGSFTSMGHGEAFEELTRSARWARGFSDFWGHALVASGRADVMVEPVVNVWDLAPLILLVEEAGGRLTDLDGRRRIDGGSVLTTNGRLHDETLRLFRDPSVEGGG